MATGPAGFLASTLLATALALAAWTDVRARIVPNALNGALAIAGLAAAAAGAARAPLGDALLAGTLALVVGVLLFAARLLGGGDVKLFAALALWLGPARTLDAALVTAVAGGVVAFATLRSSPRRAVAVAVASHGTTGIDRFRLDDECPERHVPYAVAIAIGGLWAWWTPSLLAFGGA